MNSLWHYRAYGLHWASEFELPELPVSPKAELKAELKPEPKDSPGNAPDVWVELGAPLSPAVVERAAEMGQALEWGAQSSRLLFQVARFTVSAGARVTVEPVEGYGPEAWRVPLLGSVLATLLEQRGLFALHAGALAFPGGAAAFLGDKGQGKSTLNAALSRAGFPLLSDDVVALQMPGATSEAPLALPGFAQIKLSPASLRAVTGQDAEDWPEVAPELTALDKRSFSAPLALQSHPLRALFVLHTPNDDDDDGANDAPSQAPASKGLGLRRLSVQQALAQLIPHTFGARFGETYLQGGRRKTHFLNCARLVNSCAVWELSRPRDLALLPATVELLARVMNGDDGAGV